MWIEKVKLETVPVLWRKIDLTLKKDHGEKAGLLVDTGTQICHQTLMMVQSILNSCEDG